MCKTLQRPRVSEDDSRHSDCYIKRGRDCDNDWNIRRIHGLRTYISIHSYGVVSGDVLSSYAREGAMS